MIREGVQVNQIEMLSSSPKFNFKSFVNTAAHLFVYECNKMDKGLSFFFLHNELSTEEETPPGEEKIKGSISKILMVFSEST